ncbi:MAG: hypothetical protein QM802_04125 [Agriterribacter sp.]
MLEWSNLFVATAGASAALIGLIFVGVSINLTKILAYKGLPTRALLSLTLLFNILVLSIIMLIPRQSFHTLGMEVIVLTVVAWIGILYMDLSVIQKVEKAYKRPQMLNILINQLAILFYFIGGIIISARGDAGIYWIIPGFILSFFKSIMDAWVLLVEIHR